MSGNQVGVHALVWVGGWDEADCEKAVSSAAALGFDVIEMSNTLAIWRNLWSDGEDLATQARDYIRAGLAGELPLRR